ncbi:unnamed protein product [Rotaria socialis]|uniref:Uncharacterized protein n=1 Tax=Rotaria socialis TaxID=392032 RepID=A0A821TJ87_9BILA|nr:unnamed protein product [Rotaria socialis]CAF4871381.1 unnamed protein product [Rotaria socialis]
MDNYNQDNLNIVLEDETLRSESTRPATGEEQRASMSSARIIYGVAGTKPKERPATDASSVKREVRCCKKPHKIGTWNVRTMNQGKLGVVKGEMSRINIDILGISELKWTGMGHFISDDYHIFYCGQENHRRNGVAIIVNKRLSNSVLGYNPKNDRIISIRLLGKSINVNLQQLVDATPKNDTIAIMGDWNNKVGSKPITGI